MRTFCAVDGQVFRKLGETPVFTSPDECDRFLTAWRSPGASPTAQRLADELEAAMVEAGIIQRQQAA